MGRTGTTGLRFYLRWLRDLSLYSTLCSAKTRASGEGVNVLDSLFKPSGNGGFILFFLFSINHTIASLYNIVAMGNLG
jgi:hypothetical protein